MVWHSFRLPILLTFCVVSVVAVRLLPRALAGVMPAAERQARQEIAARLEAVQGKPVGEEAIDEWIAAHAAEHARRVAELGESFKAEHRFPANDGREHPYLGDLDSYLWLRLARNDLRQGSVCDRIDGDTCRDEMAPAPVGREQIYARSLHTAAIVALHRAITLFSPEFPLSSTSYYVPVLIGGLGVVPAFLLGWRFAGSAGAVVAALAFGTNPAFLLRSLGSDNDVWNVVLPLFALWACVESLAARAQRQRWAYAAAAGLFVTAHAAVWSGWAYGHILTCTGFVATAAYSALREALQRRQIRMGRNRVARRVAASAGVYFVAAAAGTSLTGSGAEFARLHLEPFVRLSEFVQARTPSTLDLEWILWPSNFATVAELQRLENINPLGFNYNVPLLFLGFTGAALIVFPRRRWRGRHYAALVIGGTVMAYACVTSAPPSQQIAMLLFAALLALLIAAFEHRTDEIKGGALVLIIWLGAAYWLATRANRFAMFLAPPVALGLAVCADWFRRLLLRGLGEHLGKKGGTIVSIVIVAVTLSYPLYRGWVTARDFLPQMNDAWWDTLRDLQASSSPDAIIHVWWHDGHWTTYIAERRAIADGASLRTHIPYWFTRALLTADEQHSSGLLRMLACGSDATPYPEGAMGAYGKLRARGLDAFTARALVDKLAALPRRAAAAELRRQQLRETDISDVLASSHCDPPSSYLVLSSELATAAGWSVGQWDFRRAFAARWAAHRPADEAIDALVRIAGYGRREAAEVYRQAPRRPSQLAERQFISPALGYLTKDWMPCSPGDAENIRICPLAAKVSNAPQVLDAFEYSIHSPANGRLRIRHQRVGAPAYSYRTPGTILIATAQRLEEVHLPAATDPAIAILIDSTAHRILVAEAVLLRSTFTKLMFLDGRYLTRYEKIQERSAYTGERVMTYRVLYDRNQ